MGTNVHLGHERCRRLVNFKRVSQCLRKQHLNMWRQSASSPVSSLKSNSYSAHTLHYKRRRAVRRSKFSCCSLITHRLARETPKSTARARVCEDIPKRASNILMFNSALRCRTYLGLIEVFKGSDINFRSMMLSIVRRELWGVGVRAS